MSFGFGQGAECVAHTFWRRELWSPDTVRVKQSEQRAVIVMCIRLPSQLASEAIRFGVVGIKNNIIYYLLYVILSLIGVGHGFAVSAIYVFGILYSFLFNKRFVFRDHRHSQHLFARYIFVYALAWGLNLISLRLLTVTIGFNHFLAQGLLILVISGILFLSLRTFVFRASNNGQATGN